MSFRVGKECINRNLNFDLNKIKTETLPKHLLTDPFSLKKVPNCPIDDL